MKRCVLLLANPIAGRGRGRTLARQLSHRLEAEGFAVSAHDEPAESLDRAALLAREPEAALVIGGDGTLRGVAQWLLREPAAQRLPALLPVPLGTANLMGRHLGIRGDDAHLADRAAATLRQGKVRQLDAASANGQVLLLMAGVGIDGAIVHELQRRRRGPIRMASYAAPALRALKDYRYPVLRVAVDGRTLGEAGPSVAFVGNIPEYGTGFPILPDARPDDGLLDVCVLPCASPMQMVQMLLHAVAGEHLRAEGVCYARGRHVEIDAPEPAAVQVDGEAAGFTPLRIDLLPVRLPFMVPA